MCFFVHENHRDEYTAKADIPVYKVLSKSNKSLSRRSLICAFEYVPYRTYRLRRKLLVRTSYRLRGSTLGWYMCVYHGFHSFTSLKGLLGWHESLLLPNQKNLKLCLFVIPRGAKYYYNPSDDHYVSTSIRSLNLRDVSWRLKGKDRRRNGQ